ncbi:MAG: GHKL domain-containing protein [Deltaproteobacteria bacterium]|nr:GHKL domain-containing protein [Deltaproteobacteria bacterium]MBW1952599.1 GHKL domain-containing protein [Deltaproteobacteria bacterium]MBW1987154.1 GHKL domain-containing protein [Deltaproteobacteria bacterium]MBW2133908.1 GHKL domain-containing protein [Deltaproteobacteria bacterium]
MDERERLLRELVRYYRHSAVGQRCTGIVHNFNTPLQVLSLNCELLQRKAVEEQAELSPRLPPELRPEWEKLFQYREDKLLLFKEEIRKLHHLAQLIVNQGLHEDQPGRQLLNLNAIIQEELELFQADRFFKHMVEKRFRFDENLPSLSGYYIDISQSFRLLVDNALEAMESVELRVLTVETVVEGRDRIIRVGDTGPGIAPEVLPQIFEPFFTTKDTPQNPRAGLGLYMAKRLLAPYHGRIQVQSSPGNTWFTVILP